MAARKTKAQIAAEKAAEAAMEAKRQRITARSRQILDRMLAAELGPDRLEKLKIAADREALALELTDMEQSLERVNADLAAARKAAEKKPAETKRRAG